MRKKTEEEKVESRRLWYLKNKEKIIIKNKIYSKRNAEKIRERKRLNYLKNIDKIKDRDKMYYIKNRDKRIESQKKYYLLNLEKIKARERLRWNNPDYKEMQRKLRAIRHIKNREKLNLISKNYRKSNLEERRIKDKIYYQKNKERRKITDKLYVKNNKEKHREYQRRYAEKRVKIDPVFKLSKILRSRILSFLKSRKLIKKSKTEEMVGANTLVVRNHIEKKFKDGMSWENHGDWHIDHIIPLSLAKTEEDLIRLCHYTNLQPLWAVDNIRKGNKVVTI